MVSYKLINEYNFSLIKEMDFNVSTAVQGTTSDGTYCYFCIPTGTGENTHAPFNVYKIDNNGNLIASITDSEHDYGHMGDIVYYAPNNELFISSNNDNITVNVLDADTLAFKRSFDLVGMLPTAITENIKSGGIFAYNQNIDRFLLRVGKLDFGTTKRLYWIFLTPTFEVEKVLNVKMPEHCVNQSGFSVGDLIYYCWSSDNRNFNNIHIYDMEGRTVDVINLGCDYATLLEIEGCGIREDGKIFTTFNVGGYKKIKCMLVEPKSYKHKKMSEVQSKYSPNYFINV